MYIYIYIYTFIYIIEGTRDEDACGQAAVRGGGKAAPLHARGSFRLPGGRAQGRQAGYTYIYIYIYIYIPNRSKSLFV